MLMKTVSAFRHRIKYSKTQAGNWKAEFCGALNVFAEAPSLERCRMDALEALDEKLAAWIVDARVAAPKSRHRRSA